MWSPRDHRIKDTDGISERSLHLIMTTLLIAGAFGALFLTFYVLGKLGGSAFEVVGLALVVGAPVSLVLGFPFQPSPWWVFQAFVTLVFFMLYPENIIGKHTKVLGPIVVLAGTGLSFIIASGCVAAVFAGIFYVLVEWFSLVFVEVLVQGFFDMLDLLGRPAGQWVGLSLAWLVCCVVTFCFVGRRIVKRWRPAITTLRA